MAEDRYLLKHEFESEKGKLHERINEVDQKHTDNFHDLMRRLDKQTSTQENMLKSQERSETILEKIRGSLEGLGGRVLDLEYRTKDNEEGLSSISQRVEAEKKGNREVLIAWIGFLGLIVTPLMTFLANWLFN